VSLKFAGEWAVGNSLTEKASRVVTSATPQLKRLNAELVTVVAKAS